MAGVGGVIFVFFVCSLIACCMTCCNCCSCCSRLQKPSIGFATFVTWCLAFALPGLDIGSVIFSWISFGKQRPLKWPVWVALLVLPLSVLEFLAQLLCIWGTGAMDIVCGASMFGYTFLDCSTTGPLQQSPWTTPLYLYEIGLPVYFGTLVAFGLPRWVLPLVFGVARTKPPHEVDACCACCKCCYIGCPCCVFLGDQEDEEEFDESTGKMFHRTAIPLENVEEKKKEK